MSTDAKDEEPGPDGASCVEVRHWSHNVRSVPRARHDFRRKAEAWGLTPSVADSAELVVSELVGNAVRHARSPRGRLIETRYERVRHGVRIEVHDANDTWPVLQQPSLYSEFGRGLALVDALTEARWGVGEREGVGKLIWAVVSAGGADEQAPNDNHNHNHSSDRSELS